MMTFHSRPLTCDDHLLRGPSNERVLFSLKTIYTVMCSAEQLQTWLACDVTSLGHMTLVGFKFLLACMINASGLTVFPDMGVGRFFSRGGQKW